MLKFGLTWYVSVCFPRFGARYQARSVGYPGGQPAGADKKPRIP